MCYKTVGANGQERRQCEKRIVREGANSLFFRIFVPERSGLIELSSAKPGRFLLNSIVAKREHNDA
jgi:hypothetical protein